MKNKAFGRWCICDKCNKLYHFTLDCDCVNGEVNNPIIDKSVKENIISQKDQVRGKNIKLNIIKKDKVKSKNTPKVKEIIKKIIRKK